jgi:hypothetical protein
MKTNYTHVSILLDRSGSMDEIKSFIIEGFNDFIKNQKKEPGELSVTLVQFDTEYEVLQDHRSVNDIPLLTGEIYIPRGGTALNDSWVRLIEDTGVKLSAMKEKDRPEKVLLISFTDGYENASVKYASPEGDSYIKKLVDQQEKIYGWKFLYVGANQDSKVESGKKGIRNYVNFKANKKSVKNTFDSLSADMASYRNSMENDFNVKRD